jgi:hypothetical protein
MRAHLRSGDRVQLHVDDDIVNGGLACARVKEELESGKEEAERQRAREAERNESQLK